MLTQLVTGCCRCLEDKTFWKSWVEEGVDTVGNGCCCCLEDETFVLEILIGLGC